MTFAIDELQMPESLDAPGGAEFTEYATVRNAIEADTLGTDLLVMGVPELLAEYRSNPHRVRRHFVVRESCAVIGRALVTTRPHTPETGAHLMVDVLPQHRRRGVGRALLDRAEGAAREAGAPVLKVAVTHSVRPGGERVEPPTGFGDLSADDDGARFLLRHGFALEQVTRISLLDVRGLPERLTSLRDAAAAVAGDGYRLVTWTGATPDRWVADLAALRTRMSTDAPMAGMVMTEDVWDAGRVREHDERITSSGRDLVTAAVEHVASGTLAGFSEIVVASGDPVAVQEDTLVLRDHRGRRLGMLLKAATAELLATSVPGVEMIVTWNAEENRPMLDVNEAMGFRPIGSEGGWQKRV
ncbi:GNAT family N-acetyltransferase [Aeromicrobium stalagmiti]|uniref:GNAT family N-acetyltransferase n=1 Tax=Aeromicrobium stalagmiti TaxID=2738988 RepID=UPI0015692D02|nr:GNAT family N-acetyltransferase [Aeromicrobium stalagmiti]NRQ49193.1 GNAT family N-acetyltransferase [Aeromicrobium stalagmiti]